MTVMAMVARAMVMNTLHSLESKEMQPSSRTPTESYPIQTGRGGWVLLELACLWMLLGKKVISQKIFLLAK
jgi:hypothetical protein